MWSDGNKCWPKCFAEKFKIQLNNSNKCLRSKLSGVLRINLRAVMGTERRNSSESFKNKQKNPIISSLFHSSSPPAAAAWINKTLFLQNIKLVPALMGGGRKLTDAFSREAIALCVRHVWICLLCIKVCRGRIKTQFEFNFSSNLTCFNCSSERKQGKTWLLWLYVPD